MTASGYTWMSVPHVCLSLNITFVHLCMHNKCSPSGWDNEKKIAILYENFQSLKMNDNLEDVIVTPPLRKVKYTHTYKHCSSKFHRLTPR